MGSAALWRPPALHRIVHPAPGRHGAAGVFPGQARQRGLRLALPVLLRPAVAAVVALGGVVDRPGQRPGVRHQPAAARCALPFA
ncbi:hypothetical protein G6F31_018881 [Rhizopus arrhizus]|nr:hypothetical protein G6F31_018881 [Rhizopus arrhizus]